MRTKPHPDFIRQEKINGRYDWKLIGHYILNTSTESLAKNRDWRKEYLDSLESLERERQQFQALEAVLKRLAGRLCTASMGQSRQLDEQIKTLQAAMRRESTSEELDKIARALTDAIGKLGGPVGASSVTAVPVTAVPVTAVPSVAVAPPAEQPTRDTALVMDDRLRAILCALLAELRRDPDLVIRVDTVDSRLASAVARDELSIVMSSITELVTLRIQRIERSKQEVEVLLSHMVDKLDEIGRFVVDQNDNQSQSLISRETLDAALMGEMTAIGESVACAVDLDQIRTQVRGRLDSIGLHVRQFRERETTRLNEMRARNEQMRARVAQLEAEAKSLHHRLNDEQRLATIDALTNIPNRLAYEKRIEEELHRWQRFKQPICIAVWDIDRFKSINDKHGHRAGDRVLRAVADSLSGRLRSTDFLARFGGEEFVMILCGTKIEDAVPVVQEMRIAIAELKFHTHGTPLPPVTISSGVTALLPNDSAGDAFDRADKALYRAKDAGRNRCVTG
jgi:diguanylate cyclase